MHARESLESCRDEIVDGSALRQTFSESTIVYNTGDIITAQRYANGAMLCVILRLKDGGFCGMGNANDHCSVLTITRADFTGGTAATDDAVLPNILRGVTDGIHGTIYQRIQQRQRQDGFWE